MSKLFIAIAFIIPALVSAKVKNPKPMVRKFSSSPSLAKCGDVKIVGQVAKADQQLYLQLYPQSNNELWVLLDSRYSEFLNSKVGKTFKVRGRLKMRNQALYLSAEEYKLRDQDLMLFIEIPNALEQSLQQDQAIEVLQGESC